MRKIKILPYRRKLKHRTDYSRRKSLLAGDMPRLVVRKSISNINAQIIGFSSKGDLVMASATSMELRKYGWKYSLGNLPAAYLTGLMIGRRAAFIKIKKAILDLGLSHSIPGASQYALVKGALDAGLEVPHSGDVIPSESRILGKHILEYSKHAKGHQFSAYKKENIDLSELPKQLEHVKSIIIKEEEHGRKGKK